MTAITRLINIALAEVGYIEKETKSQLDDPTANAGNGNYTKYARDIDANYPEFYNGKKNGAEWCDVFVDWCFITAFGVENAQEMTFQADGCSGAGCKYSAKYYNNKKRLFKTPAIGDQIFFVNSSGSVNHTGIVYDIDDTYVYTVEGNTRPDGHEYGGCVAKKQYKLSDTAIYGYGRPMYEIIPEEPEPEPEPIAPEIPAETTTVYVKDLDEAKSLFLDLLNACIDFIIKRYSK